ncbi:MAG: hypothetical protein QM791_22795 [Ferruginibacter sp.]
MKQVVFSSLIIEPPVKKDLLSDVNRPHKKIYTVNAVIFASLVGGLFAAAYMLYKNFGAFEQHTQKRITIAVTAFMSVFFFCAEFIPVLEALPDLFFIVLTTLIATICVHRFQKTALRQCLGEGATVYSTGNQALVIVISILALGLFFLAIYLPLEWFQSENIKEL